MKKERGKLLTVLLVLSVFGLISSLATVTNTNFIKETYGSLPSWFPLYMVVGLLFGVLNLYGLWKWKKWVMYTLIASSIVAIIMQLFFLKPIHSPAGPFPILLSIAGTGLWAWAIYRKWKYFD